LWLEWNRLQWCWDRHHRIGPFWSRTSISLQIGLLPSLIGLNFNSNTFTGTIPTAIGFVKNINYLHFHSNSFKGTLPANRDWILDDPCRPTFLLQLLHWDNPQRVELLTNLNHLHFYSNTFKGTLPRKEFGLVINLLVDLRFSFNTFTSTLPVEIGLLKNLHYLD
jgi:hypothetical protein